MIRFYFNYFCVVPLIFPPSLSAATMGATEALTNETKVVFSDDSHFTFYYLDELGTHGTMMHYGKKATEQRERDALIPGCLDPVLKGCNAAVSYKVDDTFTWEPTFFGEKTHLDCSPRGLVLDTTAFGNV